jgi:hypothetical protein
MQADVINRHASNPFFEIGRGIAHGAQSIVKGVKQIQGDATSFSRAIRIVGYIFALVVPMTQMKLRSVISLTDGLVGAAQTFGSVHDLVDKTDPEDVPVLSKLTATSYLVAGAASIVELADTVHLIDLPSVSSSTGSTGILGKIKITKESVAATISTAVTAACVFIGINATIKLGRSIKEINTAKTEGDNQELQLARMKRNEAILDLAFSVTEIALCVLSIFKAIPTVALIAIGIVSASFGIAAFLYSKHRDVVKADLEKANQI